MVEKLKNLLNPWALLAVLVGAAFLSSMRIDSLSAAPGVLSSSVTIARLFEFGTYAVMLVAFRHRRPAPRNLFFIMIPFGALYLCTFFVQSPGASESTVQAFMLAGEALFGICDALLVLFYCAFFALYDPGISVVLFVLQKMLANIFTFAISALNPVIVYWSKPILFAACIIMFYAASRKTLQHEACFAFTDGDISDTEAHLQLSKQQKPIRLVSSTSVSQLDWVLLLTTTAFFRYALGAASQLRSAIWEDLALFDAAQCVFAVAADLLLLVLFISARRRFDFGTIFAMVAPFYLVAFGVYLATGMEMDTFADAMLRIGADISFILTSALAARMAYENPSGTFFYFGCTSLVTNTFPGRLVGWFLSGAPDLHVAFSELSLAVLCSLGLIAIVLFVLQRNVDSLPFFATEEEATETSESANENTSAMEERRSEYENLFLRAEAFAERLQFSQREQEILMYVLQGYTRDGIAEKLYLSPDTVKSYMNRIYLKSGVNSKKALLAKVESEEPKRC